MARIARIRTGNSLSGNTLFNIEGLEEVRQMFRNLADRSPDIYKQELERAANEVARAAKSNVNNVSGDLSSSIDTKLRVTARKILSSVIAGGQVAPHAHLVEFGHRQLNKKGDVIGDVPAHPFLRKAFDEYREQLLSNLRAAVNRLIS